jgi:hypothetical protein
MKSSTAPGADLVSSEFIRYFWFVVVAVTVVVCWGLFTSFVFKNFLRVYDG